jgi:hypothetical protein
MAKKNTYFSIINTTEGAKLIANRIKLNILIDLASISDGIFEELTYCESFRNMSEPFCDLLRGTTVDLFLIFKINSLSTLQLLKRTLSDKKHVCSPGTH